LGGKRGRRKSIDSRGNRRRKGGEGEGNKRSGEKKPTISLNPLPAQIQGRERGARGRRTLFHLHLFSRGKERKKGKEKKKTYSLFLIRKKTRKGRKLLSIIFYGPKKRGNHYIYPNGERGVEGKTSAVLFYTGVYEKERGRTKGSSNSFIREEKKERIAIRRNFVCRYNGKKKKGK